MGCHRPAGRRHPDGHPAMMPIEETLWLPVCADADLPPGQLRAIRVLGQDRVVWRTADGRLSAAPDRCPHRGTPLSMGQVQGDRLVCPYHGWAFDIEGRCRHIPALAQVVPGARQAVACHAVRERHGLIWLRAGAPHESSLLAEPPPFDGPAEGTGIRRVLCGPYDVAASAPRVLENFLDLAHFAFVHAGSLGDPAHAAIGDYRVEAGGAGRGLRATGCRAWQPKSNLLAQTGEMVEYRYEVPAPYCAVLSKCPERWQDYQESIALFALPQDPVRTRVWFLIAMSAGDRSDEQIRAFQDALFEQDRRILEAQRPALLPLDPRAEASCAIDRLSLAYRAYLGELGVRFGVLPAGPAP